MRLLHLLALAVLVCGCDSGGPPAGCRRIADIQAAGAVPLEVVSLTAVNVAAGRGFVLKVRNTSDVPVTGFKATAMLSGQEGNHRRGSTQELDYFHLPQPIPPGEVLELSWRPLDPNADRGHVLFKEARVLTPLSTGGRHTVALPNTRYEAECRALPDK